MNYCLICLEPLPDSRTRYHEPCLRAMFGRARPPDIDVTRENFSRIALEMVGKISMSGVQKKLAMELAPRAERLSVAKSGSTHILKPQIETFPNVPENEALTMVLARHAGIEVPPCGLFALPDGSWAYLIKRFDRTQARGKPRLEDFCQLAEKPPKEKYDGSVELCAKLVLRHATAPIIEASRLFRLVAFCWWVGSEDLHLKNLSLLAHAGGDIVLSPAYDLVSSGLYLEDQELALPLGGKKRNIGMREWRDLAERCKLPSKVAAKVLTEIASAAEWAIERIGRSQLPAGLQAEYCRLIRARTEIFGAA